MFDGFAWFKKFIEQVPPCYEGVLDLVLCNSGRLAKRLRNERRKTGTVKYEDCYRHPQYAMLFQAAVVDLLAREPLSYYGAVEGCFAFACEPPPKGMGARILRRIRGDARG